MAMMSPFFGANFGWNHPWRSHWSAEPDDATAPVSGPLYEGSGTGVVYSSSRNFPEAYRNCFFINDWLQKKTWLWRPSWSGALMKSSQDFELFVDGGESLYRPTDMEFGPDGALWVLGWSAGYGAEYRDGQMTSEGRIYRIAPQAMAQSSDRVPMKSDLEKMSQDELIMALASTVAASKLDFSGRLVASI
jgi:glucose/arabinose dehydrogenase